MDIFAAGEDGVQIVEENLDECVLCGLCLDASPPGGVRVIKLYDGGALLHASSTHAPPHGPSGGTRK